MSAGLIALLDDIAALAKLAAASLDDVGAAAGKATTKAVGVVVDDTAVTPRYVTGVTPDRELPMIKKIIVGSLRNKLLIILPLALLLSQFAPWLLMPLLMIGGTYLSYEGAEKIWEKLSGHEAQEDEAATASSADGPGAEDGGFEDAAATEKKTVASAVRTDFILSSEIMVIALNEVAHEPLLSRAIILVVVAIVITLGVYGVVAVIVKMDDVGLHMARRDAAAAKKIGRGLVKGMPKLLAVLGTVGTVAMLWVGGHIILMGTDSLGLHAPSEWLHHLEETVHEATGALGGVLAWLTETLCSAVVGLVVGAIVVAIMQVVHRARHDAH